MKNLFAFVLFISLPLLNAQAQGRFSFSPTLWFDYGTYAYQFRPVYSANDTRVQSGNAYSTSLGLTARYHIHPKWDVSVGVLYNDEHQQEGGQQFSKSYVRLPILVNYRSSDKRLSPYFSLGASLSNETQLANNGGIKTNVLIGLELATNLQLGYHCCFNQQLVI